MEKGVVLTATELEGCAPAADWARWIDRGRAPVSRDESGRDGAGFAEVWAEDLEQLASLGCTAIQFTLEWARLEPTPGRYDESAIEFRRDVLREARRLGLSTWACLVDGTLPGWFSDDEGGFLDDRCRTLLWPRHIDWIGETFGDLVNGWIPQREAITWALRRHLRAEGPPGDRDPQRAAEAVRAAVLADGEAWRLLQGTAPVATYQTARSIRPEPDNVKAGPLADGIERLLWHPWLSAIGEGRLVVGDLPSRQVDHLRGAFDRIIVELRPAIQIDGSGRWKPSPGDRPPGPTGWTPWPDAMAESLRRVADEFSSHAIIGAGDLADVTDDGRARPDHLQAAFDLTEEATSDTTVEGWWQSSPIDGYRWERGFDLNPGLITIDRTETPAALIYRRR